MNKESETHYSPRVTKEIFLRTLLQSMTVVEVVGLESMTKGKEPTLDRFGKGRFL